MDPTIPIRPGDTHWIHHLDPFAVHFSGDFGIRWYGLAYLAGLFAGLWLLRRWQRQGRVPLTVDGITDFVVACAVGMVVGGRLGYVLLYEPSLAVTFTADFPWWGLLAVNHGGMASHGGMIGLAIATWWFCQRRRISILVMADLIAATGPIGIALGRVANFVNGELWGRPSDVPWAVIFPQAPLIQGFQVARHPSQLYAVALEGLLILAVLLPIHVRHRRPGLTVALFLLLYSCGRFAGEFFREPDLGQQIFFGWMSKGQLYSIPLAVAGVGLLFWVWKRGQRPAAYTRLDELVLHQG
ncbi:MAG TPA: prolipoprotein diacylglyceryl transferase [Planctomycetes bacterium]|nr:prolipoprotein diacylglyceryl transferase [Planctomycetota bacterium]